MRSNELRSKQEVEALGQGCARRTEVERERGDREGLSRAVRGTRITYFIRITSVRTRRIFTAESVKPVDFDFLCETTVSSSHSVYAYLQLSKPAAKNSTGRPLPRPSPTTALQPRTAR